MEQSTFLPPRYAPPENLKTMTGEKLGTENSDLQTKNFHLQDRIKIKTHNASHPPSERPKGFQEEFDYLMADKFDGQMRLDALKDEEDGRERWPGKDCRPKVEQAWAGSDPLIAQIKKSEFKLVQDSRKASLALEHSKVKSTPATTTKVNAATIVPARVSLPELSKTKQPDFKIFGDEAPKEEIVENNRVIHFALKKMGLSDLAEIEGVSINPNNGEG
jgi:hypothetical protein